MTMTAHRKYILTILIGPRNRLVGPEWAYKNHESRYWLEYSDWLEKIQSRMNLFCTMPLTSKSHKRLIGWQFQAECTVCTDPYNSVIKFRVSPQASVNLHF